MIAKLIAGENDELDLIWRVGDQLLKLTVLAIGHASFGGAVDNDDNVAAVVFVELTHVNEINKFSKNKLSVN